MSVVKLNPDYSNRTFGLDVVRALAILTVVLVHGKVFLNPLHSEFPWIPLIDGVELFFTLSGFLIGSIFIAAMEKNGFSLTTIFKFLKRRWFRTLPNHFLVVLINLIVVFLGLNYGSMEHFHFSFFIFSQNLTAISVGFFPESWSITIEEWFYLLFPFLAFLLFLLFKKRNTKYSVLFSIFCFMLVPFFLRLSVLDNNDLWMNVRMKGIVLYKLDSIAFGLLGAFIKYYYPTVWTRFRVFCLWTGLVLIYTYLLIEKESILHFGRMFNSWIISFCILLLLPYADSVKTGKGRISRWITHISLVSYSMYLLNYSLICEPMMKYFMPETIVGGLITYGVFWALVIFLATLLYKYFEKPVMDLRDKVA